MDQFVQDQMAMLIFFQFAISDQLVVIAVVVMEVAGHDDVTGTIKVDDIAATAGIIQYSLGGLFEYGDNFSAGHGLGLAIGRPPAII